MCMHVTHPHHPHTHVAHHHHPHSFIERIKAEDAVRQEKEAARAARRAMKEVQREAMMQNAAVLWNQLKQVGS